MALTSASGAATTPPLTGGAAAAPLVGRADGLTVASIHDVMGSAKALPPVISGDFGEQVPTEEPPTARLFEMHGPAVLQIEGGHPAYGSVALPRRLGAQLAQRPRGPEVPAPVTPLPRPGPEREAPAATSGEGTGIGISVPAVALLGLVCLIPPLVARRLRPADERAILTPVLPLLERPG
jgi:hypothetical protein